MSPNFTIVFTQHEAEQKRPNAQCSSSSSWHLVVPTERIEGCCRVSVSSVSIFPDFHSAVQLVDECMHPISILSEMFHQLFFTTVVKALANLILSLVSSSVYAPDTCRHVLMHRVIYLRFHIYIYIYITQF